MMRDFVEFFVPLGIILVLCFVGVFGLIVGVDYLDCRGFAKGTGIETKWTWGCYAKIDGVWVPKSYVFGKANELRIKEKK